MCVCRRALHCFGMMNNDEASAPVPIPYCIPWAYSCRSRHRTNHGAVSSYQIESCLLQKSVLNEFCTDGSPSTTFFLLPLLGKSDQSGILVLFNLAQNDVQFGLFSDMLGCFSPRVRAVEMGSAHSNQLSHGVTSPLFSGLILFVLYWIVYYMRTNYMDGVVVCQCLSAAAFFLFITRRAAPGNGCPA